MTLRLEPHGALLRTLLAVYPNRIHTLAAIAAFTGFTPVETYYALRTLERHHIFMQVAADAWALYSSLDPGPPRARVLSPPGRGPPKPIVPAIHVQPLPPLIRAIYERTSLEPDLAPGERNPMNLTTAEIYFFRVLKRAAAVFLVLMRLNRPAGEAEIAGILDMSRKTVRAHLRSLAAANLVTRTHFHAGWTLTQGGRQMFLSPTPSPQPGNNSPILSSTTAIVKDINLKEIDSQSLSTEEEAVAEERNDRVKKSHRASNRGKTARCDEGDQSQNLRSDELSTGNCGSSTSYPQAYPQTYPQDRTRNDSPAPPESGPDGEVWQALLAAGVTPNARTRRLARMRHVTPAYIRAHHVGLQSANKGLQTGLLITILESGAPAPELNDRGHLVSCACDVCARDR